MKQVAALDPATYQRHPIHGEDRTWAETNCYSDVIIELMHALRFEPMAALPFTLAIDFEGDQWTFFKFRPQDLRELFGLELVELAPWRPLVSHIENQVDQGRPVLVELDSFFLPDTAGTAYGRAHVKSTVAVNEIDPEARHLGYFHNQGYYHLGGEDFSAIFQVEGLVHERMLPPYIEFLKPVPGYTPPRGAKLVEASLGILAGHLRALPATCPFIPFREAFRRDSDWLLQAELEVFHAYSFATFRQYGACYELAATYLRWLEAQGVGGTRDAAAAFAQISEGTKAFQFQLARAMARRRPLDLAPLEDMAELWERGMDSLMPAFAAR
jgi:hypothetical protein